MNYAPLLIIATLHGLTAVVNLRLKHIGPWTMLLGSLLILGGIYQGIHRETTQWWLVLSGLVLIIDSAIYNGYKQGQINWPHHAIRVIMCGLAILPLLISK